MEANSDRMAQSFDSTYGMAVYLRVHCGMVFQLVLLLTVPAQAGDLVDYMLFTRRLLVSMVSYYTYVFGKGPTYLLLMFPYVSRRLEG